MTPADAVATLQYASDGSGGETQQSEHNARTMLTGCAVAPEAEGAIAQSSSGRGELVVPFVLGNRAKSAYPRFDHADDRWARWFLRESYTRADREG